MTRNNADFQLGVLYHGSDSVFEPGDMIMPTWTEEGGFVPTKPNSYPDAFAHATENKSFAESYGTHLYEVEHPEGADPRKTVYNPETAHLRVGTRQFGSSKGFRVVKRLK
jgi:hypothetical protein